MEAIDKYLGFKYNNKHSSKFNAFIINDGEDLKFSNAPSFSNEFATTMFGNKTYFLGTTVENREIGFSVGLINVSFVKYRKFLSWLDIHSQGVLSFDYNKDWGYNVKVATISEGHFTVSGTCENEGRLYNVIVEVTFTTVGDFAAQPILAETETLTYRLVSSGSWGDKDPFQEFIKEEEENPGVFKITNDNTLPMFFKFEFPSDSITTFGFTIQKRDSLEDGEWIDAYQNDELSVPSPKRFIYTEYGVFLDSENNLLPLKHNIGAFTVKPNSELYIKILGSSEGTFITAFPREII